MRKKRSEDFNFWLTLKLPKAVELYIILVRILVFFTALTKCEYQRKEMRHQSFRGHVPRCKEDGSFAEIQCYHEVKICWCVDKEGRERNGTRQKGAPSNCSEGGQGERNKITLSLSLEGNS